MQSIYIESGDEVTTVIERLREAADASVGLVAPKGATLLQSVVNLKLVRKAAEDSGKQLVVITTDTIGKNLCTQLGINLAATEKEAEALLAGAESAPIDSAAKVVAGVRVHYYTEEEPEGPEAAAPEPIIIPKQLLQDEPAESAVSEPIVVPSDPEPEVAAEVAPFAETITRTTIAPSDEPTLAENVTKNEPAPSEKKPKEPINKRHLKVALFLGGVAVITTAALAFLFLPMTTIALTVRGTSWNRNLVLIAQVNPGSADALAAEKVSVTSDSSLTYKATGTKETGDKATGNVTLYNYDSTSPVTVPAGTTITASGKTFTTTAAADVPGFTQAGSGKPRVPGSKAAPVEAVVSGTESNLTDAAAADVKVNGTVLSSNTVTATGGTSKQITVMTSQDIIAAKAALTKTLAEAASQKLSETLSNRTVLSKADADATVFTDPTLTVGAGSETSEGTISGSITLSRTVVNQSTIQSIIDKQLASGQNPEHTYVISKQDITTSSVSSDGNELTISATLDGTEAQIVPLSTLPKLLAGTSLAAGEKQITTAVPTATVQVTQKPGWWPVKRYPTIDRYIRITVAYE